MAQKLMTQKEYLRHDGTRCPKCGSDIISADKMEVDGKNGWQQISCLVNKCRFTWQDLWILTGYTDK